MESPNMEKQSPEEKLVDELVGIRMQIEGKVKEDAPLEKQREIKTAVKKAWASGATCEKIEEIYYENVRKSFYHPEESVRESEFSKKLADLGTKTKEEFKKIDLNFINTKDLKHNVLNWWEDKTGPINIRNKSKNNNSYSNKNNKGNDNKSFNILNRKFKTLDKNEYTSSDFQSSPDFELENIEKKLVNELVGLNSSFGGKLSSLDILDIYKLAIKSTVQKVWKEGGSLDEIQKTYDDLTTKHLHDKKELEKQELLKIELKELKKKSLIQEELEKEKLKFEGYIQEIRKDFLDNNDKEFHCTAILENNTLFIEKKKPISKSFCGENKILYLNIVSAIYEKENPQYEYIQIYTEDFIFKLVNKNKEKNLKDFYNKLMEKINKEKICHMKNIKRDDTSSCSDADELMKWYELREKGVITQEEFENKKNKLI